MTIFVRSLFVRGRWRSHSQPRRCFSCARYLSLAPLSRSAQIFFSACHLSSARERTISSWPCSHARIEAVLPLLPSWAVKRESVPDSTSNRTMSRWPPIAAKCNAVSPASVVGSSLLAPISTRKMTTSRWPRWTATCSDLSVQRRPLT